MIILFVTVDEITAVMAAGYTVVRVYTDTSASGDFTTLDGTITLVAGTESYSYTDLDGTEDTWYKTAYYGSTPGLGTKSPARKGDTSKAYATIKELRHQIGMTGATDDVELAALLDAATNSIDNFCNRPDGFVAVSTASARYYPGSGGPYQFIDECIDITTVSVKDSASDTSYTDWSTPTTMMAGDGDWFPFTGDPTYPSYELLPYTGLMIDPNGSYSTFVSGLYTSRRGFRPSTGMKRNVPTVKVTAKWGYAEDVPAAIKQACLTQAARWYKRGQSAWADAMASADLGQIMYTKALDPAVQHLLINGRFVKKVLGRR